MFTWTIDDKAKLTPGCSLEYVGANGRETVVYLHDAEREEGRRAAIWGWAGRGTFSALLDAHDPSTIAPPTLATLNRMAVETFGEGARVNEKASTAYSTRYEVHDANELRAMFMNTDAARECARWLAARGR